MDGEPVVAPTVRRNPSLKRLLKFAWGGQERLHSTSITRQPSDRRPDAANISLRSNGNSSHNASDLQNSFHATGGSACSANAGAGGGHMSATTPSSATDANCLADALASPAGQAGASSGHCIGGAAGAANAAALGAGSMGGSSVLGGNAADLNAQDADVKDARRERLHHQHQQNKSAPVSVNRSESYKERITQKRSRNSRRKTSDPSLTSRPNDDQADVGLSNSNYTASSNSSLSSGGGSESPSTSMEQVAGSAAVPAPAGSAHHHHGHHQHHHSISHPPHHTHQHSHQDSFGSSSTNQSSWTPGVSGNLRQWNFESDEEDEVETEWTSQVAYETLAAMNDAEKKRQEIINEIYQTERSHVRTLKLLERIFYIPLQESGVLTNDHLTLLFPPALNSLRELHGAFVQQIKQRRVEHDYVVKHIGDLVADMFDGQPGEELREYAAQFCARQQIALEALKEKRRKDEQLQKLLSKAEAHKACRRLQLKDLLPTVLQRLTKYPLLFENLYKVTMRVIPDNTSEAEAIKKAVESSKKILVDVNQAVKTAEDAHKLQNIQRKLDKSSLEKNEDFKNLDLTQHRLIHDGSLTMKKNPGIQLHGLLFENMIVLLTKQDDKYSLKSLHAARGGEVVKQDPVNPIMYIDGDTLIRQEAADKNSFFLIKTKTSQMLELRAPSSSECKTWFKHISDAAEQYKPRSKNANAQQESIDDPAITTLPHSSTKESFELTPERPPAAAMATVTTTPLAPMMPPPTVTNAPTAYNNQHGYSNTDLLRNGGAARRDSTPNSAIEHHKQRLSHNELSPSVNRTMSTRSCGEAFNNYGANENNGVTLRHTQSARQANGNLTADADNASNRLSSSIVYSNNSNDTRTLMQTSRLVDPTAIQISISTAVTAQPVLTPREKLRRLDAAIRDGLLEKQKIICDMFRLPVEHFHEIVDIAAMPEAPKDSADIALAAYAQVQSLTEVVNEYMQVSAEQEISAVSTAVCDHCHDKQQQQHRSIQRPLTPMGSVSSNSISSSSAATQLSTAAVSDIPPPLPPPNKQKAQPQQQTAAPLANKVQMHASVLDEELTQIHEDDDGYCEIDELRLPALPAANKSSALGATGKPKAASPPPPLPPAASNFKTPPTPPPPPSPAASSAAAPAAELIKRQSTISADSIPEESADEVSKANMDGSESQAAANAAEPSKKQAAVSIEEAEEATASEQQHELNCNKTDDDECDNVEAAEQPAADKNDAEAEDNSENAEASDKNVGEQTELQQNAEQSDEQKSSSSESKQGSMEKELPPLKMAIEEIDTEAACSDTLSALTKLSETLNNMVDTSTQTSPLPLSALLSSSTASSLLPPPLPTLCGPNRLQHASSLEPSIPCHALNSIVSALNAQISLLLPKINDRDIERERLRKENQHLRELLNAMHERQRVEDKMDTPTDISTILGNMIDDKDIDDVDDYEEIDVDSNTSTTPTPLTMASNTIDSPTNNNNNNKN